MSWRRADARSRSSNHGMETRNRFTTLDPHQQPADDTGHRSGTRTSSARMVARRGGGQLSWREDKEQSCAPLGHVARHDKELCWSPTSDLAHAPADLAGSPRHPGGRLGGFKIVGCYFGERDWRRRQLATKVAARLSPLDAIDQMTDVGDVENSRQIRMALTTHCAAGLPVHWLRCQRPSLTAYRATHSSTPPVVRTISSRPPWRWQ